MPPSPHPLHSIANLISRPHPVIIITINPPTAPIHCPSGEPETALRPDHLRGKGEADLVAHRHQNEAKAIPLRAFSQAPTQPKKSERQPLNWGCGKPMI